MKFIKKVALVAVVAFLPMMLIGWWAEVSMEVAHVTFSRDRYCKLQFHQWSTGKSILSYFDRGSCVGVVELNNDLFDDPLAMFPGPGGMSIVCLSWPDTFDGAFTVDLSEYSHDGVHIPPRLRLEGQRAVDFSNFKVRACTAKEVEFVRHYIETVDLKTFASCTRWGSSGATEKQRAATLRFLTWATSPNDWRDPILKDAKPLILPEDIDVADAQELKATRRDVAITQFRKFASGKTVFELSNSYIPSDWQQEKALLNWM
jgi:hypothetical protein